MQRILSLFRPLFERNYSNPFAVIAAGILIAAVSCYFALQLKIDTDIANLLPESYESVQALRELERKVGGETALEVAIQSPDFEANKKFAHTLIDSALQLYSGKIQNHYFSRAEFRKETEVLRKNALYLATDEELQDITSFLKDEIEQAKLEANPFYVELDDEESEADSSELSDFQETYNQIIPSEYPVSKDSTILLVKLFATGSKSDLNYLRNMFSEMEGLIDRLEPTSYHPQMEVEYGGRLKRHLSQFSSIMNDVFSSFATGISSVLVLVALYFLIKKFRITKKGRKRRGSHLLHQLARIPVPVLVIGIPLMISLMVTFGITYGIYGKLNTMTSVLFVILFGLGIDYGIHYYARYIELKAAGETVYGALGKTYQNIGPAIITTALTTAAALYVLIFADFRGFSEFGFIAGTGIVLAMFGMLYIMPAVITVFERWHWISIDSEKTSLQDATKAKRRFPFARTILVTGFLAALVVAGLSHNIKFQYDFGALEPEFPEYDAFRDITSQVSQNEKNNPAYILADSNEEVLKILDELRSRKEADTLSPTIASVEAIQERFPQNEEKANKKLKKIEKIRDLLQDPFLRDQEDDQLDTLRQAAQTREPLRIEEIPDYLKSRFMTKQGEVGKFVVVYPSIGLGDGRNSIAFKKDIGEITLDNGKTFHAASTSLIAAEMLMLMQEESPYMVGATFVLVFIFMYMSFRSLKWAVISMLPLVVGLLWTFGVMMITGLMLNFYNLVVLPAILGIGEDNGVHMTHRYLKEGKRSIFTVLSSTGQHIAVGSFTTMLGFFGLIFTTHPGLQTIGQLAILGIGLTLLSGLILLPALLQWLEDKNWIELQ